LFRRTDKPADQQAVATETAPGTGKGRPTPSRKDAEAAARERARMGMDKKTAQKVLRDRRTATNQEVREGIRRGDERFLPARDQGPVKRFVRDWVDSRISVAEFLVPAMILIVVLGWSGGGGAKPTTLSRIASDLQIFTLLIVVIEVALTRVRLTKLVKEKFPDEANTRVTFYAYSRMITPRFMRLPKAKVKRGGQPKA
jgi:hypothetical protein